MSLSEEAANKAREKAAEAREAARQAAETEIQQGEQLLQKRVGSLVPVRYLERREFPVYRETFRQFEGKNQKVERVTLSVYLIDDVEVVLAYGSQVATGAGGGTTKSAYRVLHDSQHGQYLQTMALSLQSAPREYSAMPEYTDEQRRDATVKAMAEALNRRSELHPFVRIGSTTCPTCGREY